MKIENLERASRINDELAKLKLAKETLNNGGYVRIYSSARSSAGCVELDIANFNDEVNTCIAVSYTHLDVYKRQAYNRTTYFKGRMVNAPGGGCSVLSYVDNGDGTYTITPDPVSYTHLDVSKRQ